VNGTRESPTHGWQDVVVAVLDHRPAFSPRFAVSPVTKDGIKERAGNSEEKLDVVIATTHWFELDK
jgi:hypothetical protein